MSKEETSCRVLHAPRHFHHVLHDLFDWCTWDRHVNGPNGNHEIEPGDNVPCVLDELVEVREMMAILRVRLIEIISKMPQRIKNSHV